VHLPGGVSEPAGEGGDSTAAAKRMARQTDHRLARGIVFFAGTESVADAAGFWEPVVNQPDSSPLLRWWRWSLSLASHLQNDARRHRPSADDWQLRRQQSQCEVDEHFE